VIDYLKLFTFLSLDAVAELEAVHQSDPGARVAQKRLAEEVTVFVHGQKAADASKNAAAALFGETAFAALSPEEVQMIKESAPSFVVSSGEALVDVLVTTELASSKREARTFIESGAVQINNEKIEDLERVIDSSQDGTDMLLKRGKKQFAVVTLT
jgi:tyrosyl-tRNA synthetase